MQILASIIWGHLISGLINIMITGLYLRMFDDKKWLVDEVNKGLEKNGNKIEVDFPLIIVFFFVSGYIGLAQTLVIIANNRK
jgi:hypothetical protein